MTLPMTTPYAEAYATARSCLAALADISDGEESSRYGRTLIELDGVHAGLTPPMYRLIGRRADLLVWLEVAGVRMVELGGDELKLELLSAAAPEP